MRILTGVVFALTLFSNITVHAEATAAALNGRAELELPVLSIKLSNDGTGIIKKVTCGYCKFNFAKITAGTQVFVNGRKADVSQAAARAGKDVFITFDSKTAEVLTIRWNE